MNSLFCECGTLKSEGRCGLCTGRELIQRCAEELNRYLQNVERLELFKPSRGGKFGRSTESTRMLHVPDCPNTKKRDSGRGGCIGCASDTLYLVHTFKSGSKQAIEQSFIKQRWADWMRGQQPRQHFVRAVQARCSIIQRDTDSERHGMPKTYTGTDYMPQYKGGPKGSGQFIAEYLSAVSDVTCVWSNLLRSPVMKWPKVRSNGILEPDSAPLAKAAALNPGKTFIGIDRDPISADNWKQAGISNLVVNESTLEEYVNRDQPSNQPMTWLLDWAGNAAARRVYKEIVRSIFLKFPTSSILLFIAVSDTHQTEERRKVLNEFGVEWACSELGWVGCGSARFWMRVSKLQVPDRT